MRNSVGAEVKLMMAIMVVMGLFVFVLLGETFGDVATAYAQISATVQDLQDVSIWAAE